MNEEQLKEIAILAKGLGFIPVTFSTERAFVELTEEEGLAGYLEMANYLLLCEIQLWLLETHDVHLEIIKWDDKTFSCQLIFDKSPYEYNDENAPYEAFNCKTIQDALATGILEGLKLVKNENTVQM